MIYSHRNKEKPYQKLCWIFIFVFEGIDCTFGRVWIEQNIDVVCIYYVKLECNILHMSLGVYTGYCIRKWKNFILLDASWLLHKKAVEKVNQLVAKTQLFLIRYCIAAASVPLSKHFHHLNSCLPTLKLILIHAVFYGLQNEIQFVKNKHC